MLNHKRSALSLALAVVLAPTLASAQSTQSTTTPATSPLAVLAIDDCSEAAMPRRSGA